MAEKKAKGSGVLAPVEDFVMSLAPSIPVAQVKTWLSAYFHPMETFESNKKDSNLGGVVVHLVLIGLLSWLVAILASLAGLNVVGAIAAAVLILLFPIIFLVIGFVGSIVLFILAKIFGGKGGFVEQTFAFTLIVGAWVAMSAPFDVLGGIILVGFLFKIVSLLIGVYNIYNAYLVVKGVHQLSSKRAAAVVLIPLAVGIILYAALVAMALAALAALGASGAVAGRGPY